MEFRQAPWERPYEHLHKMEHAELELLRWIITAQIGIGRKLVAMSKSQENIMADITALTAELAEVKASADTAQAAVLSSLSGFSVQLADLKAQIDALTVGQVTQAQIDELTTTADGIDTVVDAITAAVAPPVVEPPVSTFKY